MLTLGAAASAGFGLTAAGLTNDPWIMGLILSTTSLGIVVPVLKERDLLRQPYGQAILVAALIPYAVKLLPALVFSAAFGLRTALALGMLTSARLSLIIAASAIGLSIGAITPATNAAIVLVAVVSCTLSPLLFARLAPPPGPRRSGVLVVSVTAVAQLLARRLAARGIAVRQITPDMIKTSNLAQLGGSTAQAVAVLTPDDAHNLAICRSAQALGRATDHRPDAKRPV